MKNKILLTSGFLLILALPAFALPLVPCGTEFVPCTPCHLYMLADRIIDFILKGLALPILALAFLIGGVVWLTSSGNPAQIEKGKKILTSSVIGIFIAFGGWLIVDTIIVTLGTKTEFKVGENITIGWAWNTIDECPAPVAAPRPPTDKDGGITPQPIGDTLENNKKMANSLNALGVTFNGGGDCSSASGKVSAETNFRELQRGEGLTMCQSGCKTESLTGKTCVKSGITLNPKLLPALDLARRSILVEFNIESLATGDHSLNSDHYQGNAVDIIPKNPSPDNYIKLRDKLRGLNPLTKEQIFCENAAGKAVESCVGVNHLHAAIK